jgi:hypothetical protein
LQTISSATVGELITSGHGENCARIIPDLGSGNQIDAAFIFARTDFRKRALLVEA